MGAPVGTNTNTPLPPILRPSLWSRSRCHFIPCSSRRCLHTSPPPYTLSDEQQRLDQGLGIGVVCFGTDRSRAHWVSLSITAPTSAMAGGGLAQREDALKTLKTLKNPTEDVLKVQKIAQLTPTRVDAPEYNRTYFLASTACDILLYLLVFAPFLTCALVELGNEQAIENGERALVLLIPLWQLCMNAPTTARELFDWMLSHGTEYRMSLVLHCATILAAIWIGWRSWQTLRKPVPELIDILGVEVPDSPRVELAGIRADAVTLHWARPEVNKPVNKYIIQVNGVNVGESLKQDTAITVTGLKAGNFYNVRVIAVGSNNFQALSNVIRVRTYGNDGRPILGNGRMPANLPVDDQPRGTPGDSGDEAPGVRSHGAGVEAAAIPEGPPHPARETSNQVQRRNTGGGRRHSPSTAAADQAAIANIVKSNYSEETMQQLTERFESIRRETEEVMGQMARDAEECKIQLQELYKERDERKQQLKEKEAASLSLKTEATHTERQNRQAQNRKTQKEKVLRDKQAERVKMLDDMARWRREIENMKTERESWKKEREELLRAKEVEEEEIRGSLRKRQDSLSGLEEEIRIKGLQIKHLEEERQNLPWATNDDESQQSDAVDRQRAMEWEQKERDMNIGLNQQQSYLRDLQVKYRQAQQFLLSLQAQQATNPVLYHGNSSGVDFDPTGQGKAKSRRSRNRKSRTNTISSPISGYPIIDSPFPSASAYNNLITASPNFAPGPYVDLSNDTTGMVPLSDHMSGMSEAEINSLTAGAPLSPTATSLLPSNIFENDDDPPSPHDDFDGSFGVALYGGALPPAYDASDLRQSPGSSNRSSSLISSPRASSQNLGVFGTVGRDFGADNDKRSIHSPRPDFGVIGTPAGSDNSASHKGFSSIFTFPKRGKTVPEDGLALGSLKPAQSQSLPREEHADALAKHRRISFSSNWGLHSLLKGNSTGDATTEGNAPAPARNSGAKRRRGFNMFGSTIDDPNTMYTDRDPSSPRPVSIASSDLPRPSTDSAPFGWPAAEGGLINRNSPLATNWSVHAPNAYSRNPSRRPSLQHHGSNSHLPTGLATDEDEIIEWQHPFAGQSSPSAVGVIGTKPVTPKLNPAAPTFQANLAKIPIFGRSSKSEKAKGKEKATEKSIDITASPEDSNPNPFAVSPSDSRKSRDAPSIRTQHSVAESRESESQSLERISSNTHSDTTTPSVVSTKEKESSIQKLLRKGSSSKFSFSSIRKDFTGKKAPSSAANSDRNDREGSFEDGGLDDMAHSSVGSFTSSPNIGSLGSNEGREGGRRSVNWGRPFSGFKQKGKDNVRQSIDTDGTPSEATDRDDERSENGQ